MFSDDMSDGSYVVRVDDDQRSQRSRRRHRFGTSLRGSMRGSVMSSSKGSIRNSKRSGAFNNNKERVQVISDFDSDDESIGNYSANGVNNINKEIDRMEEEALMIKRQTNVYDICGIAEEGNNKQRTSIEMLLNQTWNTMINQNKSTVKNFKRLCDLKTAGEKEIYSEKIRFYMNKVLKEVMLLIFRGYIYLIALGSNAASGSMVAKPINLLDDMGKIIYSE